MKIQKTILAIVAISLSSFALAPSASAGLTAGEDLNTVFGALGNYIRSHNSGTLTSPGSNSGEILESGSVLNMVMAFSASTDVTGSNSTPVDTSPAYAALVISLQAGAGTSTSRTVTGTDVSAQGLNSTTLTGDSSYDASYNAYLLTSDVASFEGYTFATLNTALTSNASDFKVAAGYTITGGSTTLNAIDFTGGDVSLAFNFGLTQAAADSSLGGVMSSIDGSSDILLKSSNTTGFVNFTGFSNTASSNDIWSTPVNRSQTFVTVNAVPEPTSIFVMASLGMVGLISRRKRN